VSVAGAFLPPFSEAAPWVLQKCLRSVCSAGCGDDATLLDLCFAFGGILEVGASELEAEDNIGGAPERDKAEAGEDTTGSPGASKTEEDNASGAPGASKEDHVGGALGANKAAEEDNIVGDGETAGVVGMAGATD
jgi:hypothetical protein